MSVAEINKRVIHWWCINIKNAKTIVLKFKGVMIHYWYIINKHKLLSWLSSAATVVPWEGVVLCKSELCQLARQNIASAAKIGTAEEGAGDGGWSLLENTLCAHRKDYAYSWESGRQPNDSNSFLTETD